MANIDHVRAAFIEAGWRHGEQVLNNSHNDLVGSPTGDFTICVRELAQHDRSFIQARITRLFEEHGAHGVKPVGEAQHKLIEFKDVVKDIEWKARQIASEDLLQIVDLPVEERADHAIKAASLLKGKLAMVELFNENLAEEIGKLEQERRINED